jgi:hypothetical protein
MLTAEAGGECWRILQSPGKQHPGGSTPLLSSHPAQKISKFATSKATES